MSPRAGGLWRGSGDVPQHRDVGSALSLLRRPSAPLPTPAHPLPTAGLAWAKSFQKRGAVINS